MNKVVMFPFESLPDELRRVALSFGSDVDRYLFSLVNRSYRSLYLGTVGILYYSTRDIPYNFLVGYPHVFHKGKKNTVYYLSIYFLFEGLFNFISFIIALPYHTRASN
jgi:hypothetical protein